MDSGMISLIFAGSLVAFAPESAIPCGGLTGNAKSWVSEAEVIIRARAVEELKGAEEGGGISTRVRFVALETLKGTEPPAPIVFAGRLTDRDDSNDSEGANKWVRHAGRAGNCIAQDYKRGAEFLLLLRRGKDGSLTPYWATLGATNEQLFGSGDRWLSWVRQELKTRRVPDKRRQQG